ncbi:MAG: F0F1 ATP synthase subunit B [Bacilli bacterium]|nr:F0F1 ATP synthase subunit B [Bacilli bacterium]
MNIDVASKLFPNMTTLIVQLLSTGVMFLIFKKFLWTTVQEYFAKRADFIESQMNEAKEMNAKAKEFMLDSETKARESAKEYRDIVEKAKQDALSTRDKIIDDAKKEVSLKVEQARREIEAEKAQAKEEMKEEMVTIAMEVATKVMNKEMNSEENKKMVEDFVSKVTN